MKLTNLLLILSTVNMLAANVYSQSSTINLDIEETTVKDVLQKIEEQSRYYFMYSEKIIDAKRNISIKSKNQTINEVLDQIFTGTNVTYKVNDPYILLSTPDVIGKMENLINVQPITISGTVTDQSGEPLTGVTVVIKGTTNGTITNVEGKYTLRSDIENVTLVFSYIGYQTQEIPIDGQTEVDVILVEAVESIEEVVVVGYGTQKRSTLTGSVAAISSDEITKIKTGSFANTLVGKLPGLRAVQRSGAPGADIPEIDIRGFGNALTIVDGVERSFAKLDPNQIESISILKDASAAVYGSRGANGVILITTKKGEIGEPKFNYNGWYGFQQRTRYPEVYNSYQYALLTNEAANNIGLEDVFNEDKMRRFEEGDGEYYKSVDWLNEVNRKLAPQQSHSFSITGGSEPIKYYTSLNYLNQQSSFRSGDWFTHKYNFNTDVDAKLGENISASISLIGQKEDINISGGTGVFQNIQQYDPFGSARYYGEPVGPLRSTYKEYGYTKNRNRFLYSTMDIDINIPWIDGLSAKAKLAYDYTTYSRKNFTPKRHYTYEVTESDGVIKRDMSALGRNVQRMGNNTLINAQYSLNYQNSFGDHNVSALLLYEVKNFTYEWIEGEREYDISALEFLRAGNDLNKNNDGLEGSSLEKAWIGRVNYDYKEKYLLEATLRYDATSIFHPDERWGLFPSFSIGWKISEESFFSDNITFINLLKPRVSYGIIGDATGFAPFQWMEGYNYPSGTYVFDPGIVTYGLLPSGVPNRYLTWFQSNITNVGLEVGMFQNRMTFEIDYFKREREGLLANRLLTLPISYGRNLPQENLNSDLTKGFELMLGHKNSINGFYYYANANFSITRSMWLYVERAADVNAYENWRNNPTDRYKGITWGYTMIGQFQDFEEILNSPIQDNNGNRSLLPGDFKYEDINGDNIIDDLDIAPIGANSVPYMYYGLDLGFKWNGLDFNMFWQGAAGHNIQLGQAFYQPFMNDGNSNGMTIWMERSYQEDPEDPDSWVIGKLPPVRKAGFANNEVINSYYLLEADYLRLKTLEIGYSVPGSFLTKIGLQEVNLRLFANGNNLVTLTKGWLMKNIDPENNNSNAWYYPQMKTYNFGLNLTF